MKKVFGTSALIPPKLLQELQLKKKHFKKRANSINRYGYEPINREVLASVNQDIQDIETTRRPKTNKLSPVQATCPSNRRNLGISSAESPMRFHKKLNEDSGIYSKRDSLPISPPKSEFPTSLNKPSSPSFYDTMQQKTD